MAEAEQYEYKASLGYTKRSFLKITKQNETIKNEVNYQDRMGIIQSD